MNRINPNKLLLSKWSAVNPEKKEKHFIVSELIRDENEVIVACKLEAVLSKTIYEIDWKVLKNKDNWLMGWK